MQFDVYANPITRARRTFPYVAVLQHDLAETGHDRVAAFLAPRSALPRAAGRIAPVVDVDGRSFVLLVHLLTNLPAADLKIAIGNVSAHRDRIVEALDWLFLGV
jgi:toxin CcdB